MIIYRYIIKEHILPFFYSLGILIFIFAMQLAVQMLDKIISKGLSIGVVLELFLINIAWVIALAIPMAILVSTLMAFGTMSGNNEIMAIKASGHNVPFLLTPVFCAACVLTVVSIYFNNDILPDANHRAANLLTDISRKKPAALIDPGVLITSFENYALYVKKVNSKTGEMSNVKIFSSLPGEDPSTTVAERGDLAMTKDEKFLKLTLYNGETHRANSKNKNEYFVCHFRKQIVFIKNIDTEFKRSSSTYRSDREMSSTMMLDEIKQYRKNRETYLSSGSVMIDTSCTRIDSLEARTVHFAHAVRAVRAARDTAASDGVHAGAAADSGKDSAATFAAWASHFNVKKDGAVSETKRKLNLAGRIASQVHYEDLKISQLMVEVHKKFSIPVACIVFVLIGAPLGIMARRGGIMVGASYSLFFFIVYWAFLIAGESMADDMVITPFAAMWTADILIGACGLVLLVIMTRETKFISFSFVTRLFAQFFKQRKPSEGRRTTPRGLLAGLHSGVTWCMNLPYRALAKVIGILPAYLIRKFFSWFFGLMFVVIIVFVAVDWVSNLKRFEDTSFLTVAKFYWYYLPWLAGLIIPIVILLASMSAIGSMVRLNELTAVKAAGVSVRRLSFALVVLGLCLAGLGFYIGEGVLPHANMARRELLEKIGDERAVKSHGAAAQRQEYRRNFYYFGDNRTIYHFDEFRTDPSMTKNVWRQTFEGASNDASVKQRVSAESENYKNGRWVFKKGMVRTFHGDSVSALTFDTLVDTILNVRPQDMVAQIHSPEEMSYWELAGYVDKSKRRGEDVSKWNAQLDFKIALPMMNFIVILLGISISARAGRRGGAVLFGIGLLLIFAYWIISQFAIAFAQNGQLPPLIGAWFGNLLFLTIALPLYGRASR
jgi:lipopolysaccharide export system permease protein